MKINLLNKNSCEIEYNNSHKMLQSYKSIVAEFQNEELELFQDWDYSKSTIKHLLKWLINNKHSINCLKKIKDEEINTSLLKSLIKKGDIINGN